MMNVKSKMIGCLGRSIPLSIRQSAQNLGDAIARVGAKKPSFVIVGTGRCGTNFVADYMTAAGYPCGHERFFRPTGPLYREGEKKVAREGDSSWLAVPFLENSKIPVLHQTRAPLPVIKPFVKIGFFHPEHYDRHRRFVDFARQHFTFSEDPVRSAMRWWIEWNEKCSEITKHQFRLEEFQNSTDQISAWLGLDEALPKVDISADTNTKRTIVSVLENEIEERVRSFPEYERLVDLAAQFGYEH